MPRCLAIDDQNNLSTRSSRTSNFYKRVPCPTEAHFMIAFCIVQDSSSDIISCLLRTTSIIILVFLDFKSYHDALL